MEIEHLGKYEVQGVLGKGAMGTVYSGWDPIISRKVAIKTVRLPDAADIDAQEELARFKREAQAAGRLSHPNIVGVFDYGETEQVAFIVMEFVAGTTLKALIDAGERMPVAQVARVMADVLSGLSYSHERGVIHRDIKPANIMIVGGDGHGSGQAKIADFGIARIESSNMTQAGTIMGTPAYMSPEQFMGQTVDARTDIYSAGVLLFQLLTGERPFEGSMATIMHKALNTQPPKPSELSVTAPVALDAVVTRAMAKRPEERYANAADFAQALQAGLAPPAAGLGTGLGDLLGDADADATMVMTGAPKAAPPKPAAAPTPAASKAKSRVPLIAAAAVVVLALAGGGAWFALSGPSAPVATTAGPRTMVAAAEPPASSTAATPQTSATTSQQISPSAVAASTPTPLPLVTQVVPQQPTQPLATTRPPTQTLPPVTEAQTPAAPTPTQIIPPAAQASDAAASRPPAPLEPPTPATVAPAVGAVVSTAQPPAAVVTPPQTTPPQTTAPQTATPANPPSQLASAGLTAEALRRAVASAVTSVDCAVIGGEAARGTVTLTGAVGQGRPEQELHRAVQDAVGSAPVDWNLAVVPGPYCGVFAALRPHARPFGVSGPTLQLGTKDGRTDLLENDHVELRSVLPDFSSYLQLDYFQSDGTVSHLLNAAAGTPVLLSGTSKEVLAGQVGSPFGTDLVVAIATSTPLFAKGVSPSEKTDDYVRELRTALDEAARRSSRLAVSLLVLKTSPRP